MAVTKLTLDGKRFVVLPESEYMKLKASGTNRTDKPSGRGAPRAHQLTAQERGDIAESARRLANPQRIDAEELFRQLRI